MSICDLQVMKIFSYVPWFRRWKGRLYAALSHFCLMVYLEQNTALGSLWTPWFFLMKRSYTHWIFRCFCLCLRFRNIPQNRKLFLTPDLASFGWMMLISVLESFANNISFNCGVHGHGVCFILIGMLLWWVKERDENDVDRHPQTLHHWDPKEEEENLKA